MDYPWIIHGLSMDYPWIIHGLSMDYPWIIHRCPWIIHGHPWISMDFQGLGEPVGHVGGAGQLIPGEPFGRGTLTHTLYKK